MANEKPQPLAAILREPPDGIRRSAYEVEVNPWSQRGEVEASLFFRGAIVSAYGYIETRLSELSIRLSRMPEFQGLRDNFPYKMNNRLSYLRRAFSLPPLSAFEPLATLALDRFDSAGELRHQVAHARMQVLPGWGVTFEDYRRGEDGGLILRRKRYQLPDLERAAWRATVQSRLCQRMLDKLERRVSIPSINT